MVPHSILKYAQLGSPGRYIVSAHTGLPKKTPCMDTYNFQNIITPI